MKQGEPEINEKITTYLAMGVALALVVRYPEVISQGIVGFAGGVAKITTGIVGGG